MKELWAKTKIEIAIEFSLQRDGFRQWTYTFKVQICVDL